MSEHFLRIRNRHAPDCGDPPIVSNDERNRYIGYFENSYGEQWIFTYHRTARKAELRGGDVGWHAVHEVKNGGVARLILGQEESAWLQACWRAAVPEK